MHGLTDAWARTGWRVLLLAGALGLVAGVVEAIAWVATPADSGFQGTEGACAGGRQPPCFDVPDLSSMPITFVPTLAYTLAILVFLALAVPSLPAAGWDAAHRRWRSAARALLTFAGPLLVVIGTEIVPHAVVALPCAAQADPCSRFHQLEHVVLGLVPMTLLYRSAVHRWVPGILH